MQGTQTVRIISDSSSELERYLYNRRVDINDGKKPLEISENEALLAEVAGAWKTDKNAIQAVVRARLDALREKLIFSALPQEVPVIRQAMVELAGVLEDFETVYNEYANREAQKGTEEKPEEGN